ncbi:MAG: hypothetical protein B7Y88_07580 [Sphingomonadales bacterium 32-64-17]|nr:MAG: hypothetical protein B7Y88_07580 [Sphingomonadales bacterium 32-64-17]
MVATIGYEKANLSDFIATLQLGNIDILVDIRDRAQSRRPGFSKSRLSSALEEAGIAYLHFRELGDPKEGREAARQGDFAKFRRIFSNVLSSERAQQALAKLEELASQSEICLMCYERDQATCHRKIVSDCLEVSLGKPARHLGVRSGAGKSAEVGRVRDTYQGTAASL